MPKQFVDLPGRVVRMLAAAALVLGLAALALPAMTSAQDAPSLSIVSPAAGASVTTDDIEVQVEVTNFTLDCEAIGAPNVEGHGLIHALLYGSTIAALTGLYCEDTFTISGEGVTPGEHTLTVVLSENNHADLMDTAQQVTFDFQPANAQPLPAANDTGVPVLTLVSPTDGATVDPVFTVEVSATNFTPDAGLEGKANVPGYGHYHVVVTDPAPESSPEGTATAEPAGIPGLIAMPGENTFQIDLTGWGPGEHHLMIAAAQNDHTGYEGATPIEFTVVVK
jgi:hypothetical protein